jgi:histidinol phosphatase-like enzyme
MKKLVSMAFVLITAATLTAGSSSVFSQDTLATVSPTANSGSPRSAASEKDFQEHKARILQRISDRLTKIQRIQSCVQAANDLQSLRACKPHKDKMHNKSPS